MIVVAACGGQPHNVTAPIPAKVERGLESSCREYADAVKLTLTRWNEPSDDMSSFIAQCEAMAAAPGAGTSALDACTKALRAPSCDTPTIPCVLCASGLLRGALADGGPCSSRWQCAGGRCDLKSMSGELACGACGSYKPLGSACSQSHELALLDLECDPRTGTCVDGKCAAYAMVGGACRTTGEQNCAAGLECEPRSMTCQPHVKPTKGQACPSTSCANPYRCIQGTCVDAVGEGGACSSSSDCAAGLVCDPPLITKCTKPTIVQAGESCWAPGEHGRLRCAPGLVCSRDTSECIVPKPAGAACVPGNEECAKPLLCMPVAPSPGGPNFRCATADYSVCK